MPTWEYDPSEPLINPDGFLSYFGELPGCDPEALALPDLLVGTFQQLALEHMAARIGGSHPERWPTPIHWPLTRGSLRGRELAVTRLPIGAPAAAMALELMIAAGVRTVLLVGSAGSLQPSLPTGSLLIATRALRHEGTSHHYLPAGEPASASSYLVDALISAALQSGLNSPATGATWTTDAPFRECADSIARHRASGILAVEMEAAALYAVAAHRRARAALIVAISDELQDRWRPGFRSLAYQRALLRAADLALEAASRL